jgi:hypothetical protein
MVALMGKNGNNEVSYRFRRLTIPLHLVFAIANKQLEQLCLVNETVKIKSGTWDEIGIFVYSTQNHIKYSLPQG